MISYEPPYTITDRASVLISTISEKIGSVSHYKNTNNRPHLRRNNRIKSIHASLKIEANSLSFDEVRDVINGQLVLGKTNEIQEVKNAYLAYEKISEINPYSLEDLKKVHKLMTALMIEEAGIFRTGEEGVFAGDKCIFVAPPPQLVPELMRGLFSWMDVNKDNVHPLVLAAVFHYEFVFIHPFSDGNGRMARLWHNVLLTKWRGVFEYIPLESQIEKFQDDYYDAIAKCHAEGKSDFFIEFILEKIDEILDEVILQFQQQRSDISEYVKRLLNVMEEDTPYSAVTLLELLHLKSRETLRKNYLHPAIELGLVQLTIPEKVNSKNQRYIIKN